MKKTLSLITLTFMALPMVASASHQLTYSSRISEVTIKLTETDDTPSLVDRDGSGALLKDAPLDDYNEWTVVKGDKTTETEEYGQKYITSKISNQEILQGLLDDGIIEDESISGWYIVVIDYTLYAVKGKITDIEAYVDIDDNFNDSTDDYAWDENGSYIYTTIGENPTKYKVNYTYSEVGTATFSIYGAAESWAIELEGSFNYFGKDVLVPASFGETPGKISWLESISYKLSGYGTNGDTFIEGSIDFSLEKFIDKVVFP